MPTLITARPRPPQLTLVLPNLLDAAPAALEAACAPSLARLLSSGDPPVGEAEGPLAIACEALGIAKQNDWPAAPWLARSAGIDPGERYWLCAVPVTLEVGRDEVRLAAAVSDLDAAESTALLSALRAHFVADGVEFVAARPGQWWVATVGSQRLETSLPEAALGKPLIAHLPRGADAARWRRWQSEMQMLLFDHPVNRARETNGHSPVNYVWLWGGGTLRTKDSTACVATVFTHSPLVRDLGGAAGTVVMPVPDSFAALRAAPHPTPALVWLDALDANALQNELAAFDSAWAAPLERALDGGELSAELVIAGSASALSFAPTARGTLERVRSLWSRPPKLQALLAAHASA